MTENAITVPEYTETAQALAELEGRMANVVHDVTTGKGMVAAKKDVAELRGLWVALEDRRKAIKAPALERCRLIDSEAKLLEARLKGLAEPIKAQIDAEEQRKEREKAAREEAERQRVAAINARFDAVKRLPLDAVGKTAAQIEELIAGAEAVDDTGFPDDALTAAFAHDKRMAIGGLRAALDARRMADREAEKIAAERAELENLRRVAAEQQAELDRKAEAERQRQAEEARRAEEAAQAERAAAEAAARAEREAKEAAERAERQAAQEAADRERRERQAAEDAERAAAAEELRRKAQEVADERARVDAEKKAAAKKAREQAIANATLTEAASEALALLIELGEQDHLTTQKLAAALKREPARAAA